MRVCKFSGEARHGNYCHGILLSRSPPRQHARRSNFRKNAIVSIVYFGTEEQNKLVKNSAVQRPGNQSAKENQLNVIQVTFRKTKCRSSFVCFYSWEASQGTFTYVPSFVLLFFWKPAKTHSRMWSFRKNKHVHVCNLFLFFLKPAKTHSHT